MNKKLLVLILGSLLILNVGLWVFFRSPEATTKNPRNNLPYLSARIFADNPNDILIRFVPLRKVVEAKFASLPEETKYSFYFEYLPSGTSIRISENDDLVAASLIKVPLVMNLYRAAELGKLNLDQKVTIQQSELDAAYGDLWKQGAGVQYTLRELAKLTLEQSDNTASRTIFDHVKGLLSEEEQSLAQLDVDQNLQNGQAVINAISYASVLKSLYFSSFLNRDNSNELLGYLTHSAEHNRLTKRLPNTIKVAHKNGVYNQSWAESDCGIVYTTKRPYAICVMVGLPEDRADNFIADISKTVYDYVVSSSE